MTTNHKPSAPANVAHTPGPWHFEIARWTPDSPAQGFVITSPGSGKAPAVACSPGMSGANHCYVVADEHLPHIKTGYSKEECEANARLIAAAPLMLEALQQAAFAIPTTHGTFATVNAAIKAALAK